MKFLPVSAPGFVLGVLLLVSAVPAGAVRAVEPVQQAQIVRALRLDLEAITTGSQPTEAQMQALADDLARLFPGVDPAPTATLGFVVDKLAEAASHGLFAESDREAIALEVAVLLNGSRFFNHAQANILQSILVKAGIDRTEVKRLAEALRGLVNVFDFDIDSRTRDIDLQTVNGSERPYRKSSGTAYLGSFRGPLFADNAIVNLNGLSRSLFVQILQVPKGRYHVSVTTRPNGAVVELGAFRAHYPPALVQDFITLTGTGTVSETSVYPGDVTIGSGVSVDPVTSGYRFGAITFSDAPNYPSLPEGVSLADVTGITVSDDAGNVQFTGSFADGTGAKDNRLVRLHLITSETAPAAGGSVQFGFYTDSLDGFTLKATGLPANATLNLLIDGTTVTPVQTGPTGKLFVNANLSGFPKPPKISEIINSLPASANLSAAKSFSIQTTQGEILLSGGLSE